MKETGDVWPRASDEGAGHSLKLCCGDGFGETVQFGFGQRLYATMQYGGGARCKNQRYDHPKSNMVEGGEIEEW